MVKFVILADVHGNFDALQTILDDIDNREDIDQIFNLSDNIGTGHETNKVLDMIPDRDGMEIIVGNHDEAITSIVSGTPYPEDLKNKFYERHQWIESRMDEDYYNVLNTLPRYLEKTICGKKCLFAHYKIENQRLEEGIDKQPLEPIVDNQKEEIVKLLEGKGADFIALGHNHQLHLYDDNNKTYFNPDLVGPNNGKYVVYGIVTINENEFSAERVKLPYDDEEFLQEFDEKHVPGR